MHGSCEIFIANREDSDQVARLCNLSSIFNVRANCTARFHIAVPRPVSIPGLLFSYSTPKVFGVVDQKSLNSDLFISKIMRINTVVVTKYLTSLSIIIFFYDLAEYLK